MFKKTMKFDNLEGEEVEQTFYFNFNKKEIAELLEFGAIQKYADPNREYLPLEEMMTRLKTPTSVSGLSETENTRQAYNIFQDLILDAYGVKGADNVTFDKTHAHRAYWESHVAFPEMIIEMLADTKLAGQFMENCLPPRLVAKAKEEFQAEHEGKLAQGTLNEMVQEAERRQQDPATRVAPGEVDAEEAESLKQLAAAAVAKDAESDNTLEAKDIEDLTETDILEMDDIAFKKLDVRKLSKRQMMWAFARKNQG